MCFFWPHRGACASLVPQPGIELRPWQGRRGVLATGPLGNSVSVFLFFFNLHACEGRRLNKALTKAAPGVSTVNTRRRQDGHSYQANTALSRWLVRMPAWSGCRILEAGFRRRRSPGSRSGSPPRSQRGLCPGIRQVAAGKRGGRRSACPQWPVLCLLRPRGAGSVPDSAGQRGGRLPLGPRGPVSAPHSVAAASGARPCTRRQGALWPGRDRG